MDHLTHLTFYFIVLVLALAAWFILVGYEIALRHRNRDLRAMRTVARVAAAQRDELVTRLNDSLLVWDWPDNNSRYIEGIARAAEYNIAEILSSSYKVYFFFDYRPRYSGRV